MSQGSHDGGFSMVELILALGITVLATTVIFDLVGRTRRRFDEESHIADRQQRVRVAVDALYRDLAVASAVLPYRLAGPAADSPGSFYTGVATVIIPQPEGEQVRTYFVDRDTVTGWFRLARAEGAGGGVPVVDQITELAVDYFGTRIDPAAAPADPCASALDDAQLVPLAAAELSDGPWCAVAGVSIDADLLRTRQVVVRLRVAGVPGPVRFAVAPRNLNRQR
jgi:hypothetical protein